MVSLDVKSISGNLSPVDIFDGSRRLGARPATGGCTPRCRSVSGMEARQQSLMLGLHSLYRSVGDGESQHADS